VYLEIIPFFIQHHLNYPRNTVKLPYDYQLPFCRESQMEMELKIHAFNWVYIESQCWCYFVLEVCRIPARWHGYILSGLIFLILGIVCLILTQQVLNVLLIIFGAIALILGILLIVASVFVVGFRLQWVPLLFFGIILIIIGLVSIYYPATVIALAIYLISGVSLFAGVLMVIYGAISFVETKTRVLIILLGLIPIIIAIFMVLNPGSAAALVLALWGIFACFLGVVLIIQGLVLRRVNYELGCNEEDA
jgi:uncharacterized membrane protein HdeD (DUF308 family)